MTALQLLSLKVTTALRTPVAWLVNSVRLIVRDSYVVILWPPNPENMVRSSFTGPRVDSGAHSSDDLVQHLIRFFTAFETVRLT